MLTVRKTIDHIEQAYGARYLLNRALLLRYVNVMQMAAYTKDLPYFVEFGQYLTIVDGTLTYSAPANCRKIIGVTTLSDTALLGNIHACQDPSANYGLSSLYARKPQKYVDVRIDPRTKSVIFPSQPLVSTDVYRLIYYVLPPEITSETDDDNYVIPEEWKDTVIVRAIGDVLANSDISGDAPATRDQLLLPYLTPFWDSIASGAAETHNNNSDSNPFI